jgi:hypothetical protein
MHFVCLAVTKTWWTLNYLRTWTLLIWMNTCSCFLWALDALVCIGNSVWVDWLTWLQQFEKRTLFETQRGAACLSHASWWTRLSLQVNKASIMKQQIHNALNIDKSWNANNKSGRCKCTLACTLLRVNMTLETLVKLLKMHKQITNNVKKCNKINWNKQKKWHKFK